MTLKELKARHDAARETARQRMMVRRQHPIPPFATPETERCPAMYEPMCSLNPQSPCLLVPHDPESGHLSNEPRDAPRYRVRWWDTDPQEGAESRLASR